jgi:hypothetical protein
VAAETEVGREVDQENATVEAIHAIDEIADEIADAKAVENAFREGGKKGVATEAETVTHPNVLIQKVKGARKMTTVGRGEGVAHQGELSANVKGK